uniref:uncharacterized protein LOC105351197 n=1 Tax=Fragaria vesca subsp. vesca TaxID=101020 RepID=UPI0005C7F7BC|nr:PREDICTED: uncharacterized protein LOC105351197 [Fragaria vesca subsp. vesca]
MEANKEEALKAKQIAELKVERLDYAGAKRFALKAQDMYPELDGLQQFLATLDVYTSAEKGKNGEVNWYKVLGVEPLADQETVQRQFRKLALLQHPDRNKSVGAEGAFQLLHEARRVLSEKKVGVSDAKSWMPTTGLHDFFKRDERSATPSMPSATPAEPCATPPEPFATPTMPRANATKPCATGTKPCEAPTKPYSISHAQKGQKSTFWTICSCCMMYFEYLRVFLNHKLQCHNCQQHFIAYKIPPPKNASKSKPFDPPQQKFSQPSMPNNPQKFSQPGMPNNPSGSGRTHAAGTEMRSKGISSIFFNSAGVQNVQARASTSSQAGGSAHSYGVKPRRKRYQRQQMPTKVGMGNGRVAMNNGFGSPKFSSGRERPDAALNHRFNCIRDLSLVELQNVLLKKAKKELVEKLDKSSNPSVPKTADADVKEKGLKEAVAPDAKADMTGSRVSVDAEDMPSQISPPANSHVDSDVEDGNTNSMSVPDPDFHDFDNDRTEKSFASDQVWAVYDDDDGMPRYYAMIHSIISLKPFKIRISWLNSKTNHELAPLDWVACGFPKTSGDLRIGKHGVYKYLHSFSHKVKWTKGRRGAVRIYPGKGDVWALYRNWSPDWDQLTPDEVIHKYDMVQVLEDYDEERGVSIVPLVKVAGFKTVFRQHSDRRLIRTIPRKEMFRFSHQVPYYLLSGLEGENAPKGCLELDPASTPLELLQVKTEAQAKMEETAWKCNGEENGKVAKETGLVEDAEKKDLADLMKKDPQETKWQVYSRKRPREGEAVEGAKRLWL